MKRVGLTFLLLAGAVGCKASVNAEAKAGASGSSASADGDASFDASAETEAEGPGQGQAQPTPAGTGPSEEAVALAATGPALLGARRDLKFQGSKQATCSCLAVELGAPNDAAFAWEHGPPSIDAQQIVVALSSDGVSCTGEVGLGASYKGYQTPGNDVVIMVERAHQGRPVTSGAVIPRPIADGQVYVVAAEKGSPFGGAMANSNERCKLELPPASAASTAAVVASASPSGSGSGSESELVLEEPPSEEASEFVDNVDESASGEDKAPEAPETRDGFFLALHPSGSYVMLLDRETDTKIQGFGFGLDVLVGGAVSEGLSLGVILGGAFYPSPESEVAGSGTDFASNVDLNLFHISAFIDYYTDPDSGLHLIGELGYGQLETTGSDVESQTIQGVLVAGGIGYDWWVSDSWSLGLLGRFSFGATQHTQSDTEQWLLLPALNFTATYH